MIMSHVAASVCLVLLAIGGLSAQKAPELWSMEHREQVARQYGIADLKLPYKDAGESPFASAQPVADWLKDRFKARIVPALKKGDRLIEFTGDIIATAHEDDVKTTFSSVNLRVGLGETIEGGGATAANYLARSQVSYHKGSFSGSPVGDWTASRFDNGVGAALVFFRKNAFVYLSCKAPMEVTKSDRSMRVILPDASLRQKCEDLARDMDAELLKLPNVEKEAK